jgi:hypothetical protein
VLPESGIGGVVVDVDNGRYGGDGINSRSDAAKAPAVQYHRRIEALRIRQHSSGCRSTDGKNRYTAGMALSL